MFVILCRLALLMHLPLIIKIYLFPCKGLINIFKAILSYKNIGIIGKKRSSGFRRIFTVDFNRSF